MEEEKNQEKETKTDGKTYSSETRLLVYDAVVNNVPTQNIPNLIESQCQRLGHKLNSIPHRSTIEQMTRELDTIADLKVADLAMTSKNLTIGFDATTQEGVHINAIHLTTENDCEVVSVEHLAGGTSDDYCDHICAAIDHVAETYSNFHQLQFQDCRTKIIENISNTMSDRAAVNHATIEKVNLRWDKQLNELNCHLHPLDSISSACRSALKSLETTKGHLFGKDCIAANIVLQVNKFRYKDGKGDPNGFKVFLTDNQLPKGLIPRYRGNRLHILFHICGIFHHYQGLFSNFFKNGAVSCGGLRQSISKDFETETAKAEIQCLGLLGKLLTGPWMTLFYMPANADINHVEGINVIKSVVLPHLKAALQSPLSVLNFTNDFFDKPLDFNDMILSSLMKAPSNAEMFEQMVQVCLTAIIAVIERQYQRYFTLDVTEELKKETTSARTHNIDAEQLMGMFSAGKERAKNATVDFLTSKMRARKNKVMP